MRKIALVLGAGGFIGHHLAKRLIQDGFYVVGSDLKYPEFEVTPAHLFMIGDLRSQEFVMQLMKDFCEIPNAKVRYVFQLAADMGGAGYVFTGLNDASILHNSAQINLNVLESIRELSSDLTLRLDNFRIFYSSSACIYPQELQQDSSQLDLKEEYAYPANPDSDYGWEKLFSERLYAAYSRNFGISVRVARYHNIYGPLGTWKGGREKAPAAICRKIALISGGSGEIEVWGDGKQTRSFLFIDDCVEATIRLMESNYTEPVNIGSEEMVSVDDLCSIVGQIAQKDVRLAHLLDKPTGVRGRNSNNELIRKILNWDYKFSLADGLVLTYEWINQQLHDEKENS